MDPHGPHESPDGTPPTPAPLPPRAQCESLAGEKVKMSELLGDGLTLVGLAGSNFSQAMVDGWLDGTVAALGATAEGDGSARPLKVRRGRRLRRSTAPALFASQTLSTLLLATHSCSSLTPAYHSLLLATRRWRGSRSSTAARSRCCSAHSSSRCASRCRAIGTRTSTRASATRWTCAVSYGEACANRALRAGPIEQGVGRAVVCACATACLRCSQWPAHLPRDARCPQRVFVDSFTRPSGLGRSPSCYRRLPC